MRGAVWRSLTHIVQLKVVDDNMTRSRQIMRKMYAKVISNKILLTFIIVCEIVTLMFVVWYKWIR